MMLLRVRRSSRPRKNHSSTISHVPPRSTRSFPWKMITLATHGQSCQHGVRVEQPAGPEQYRRRMRIESNVWLTLPGSAIYAPALLHAPSGPRHLCRPTERQRTSGGLPDIASPAGSSPLLCSSSSFFGVAPLALRVVGEVLGLLCCSADALRVVWEVLATAELGSLLRTVPHIVSASTVPRRAEKTSTAGFCPYQSFLVLTIFEWSFVGLHWERITSPQRSRCACDLPDVFLTERGHSFFTTAERGSVRVPNRRCGVPFNRLLRRRSAWVVGTCCTRPWRLGTCVRSERLATVPSWTVCLSCSPTTLSCRDLLHSALASWHLSQVRAARHCSFLDSVLELLTDDPELSGPVALGPGIRALVSGQNSSPLLLPGQCAGAVHRRPPSLPSHPDVTFETVSAAQLLLP